MDGPLHGRVYSADLKPLAQYTVFLVDSQKTYQETYGFAYTDDTGIFPVQRRRSEDHGASFSRNDQHQR
jgi:hypothetical protein